MGARSTPYRSAPRWLTTVHVLLDSTVLIDFLRGRPAVGRVRQLVAAGADIATSSVNVEEIVRGIRPTETAVLEQLLSGLVVLPADETVARVSGRWRAEHAERGVTLHQADCLVAATAAVHGARLCTGNPKDFPMIEVEYWPVGA